MKFFLKNKYTKILLSLILFYTIVGFLIFPFLLKSYLNDITTKHLNAGASVKSIYFNPYTFEMSIEDFVIYDTNDEILGEFALLDVNLNTIGLFKSKLLFTNIYLKNFNLNVEINKENIFNFDNITSHLNKKENKATSSNDEDTKSSTTIFIENFHLDDATFAFIDDRGAESFEVKSRPFDFMLKDFSTAEQEEGVFEFMVATYKTGQIKSSAKIRTVPFKVEGDFNIIDFNTNKLYGYFKQNLDFKVSGDNVNASLKYAVSYENSILDISLSQMILDLKKMNFSADDNALEFVKLDTAIDKVDIIIESNRVKINIDNINLDINKSIINNKQNKLLVDKSMLHVKNINIDENSSIKMSLQNLQFLDTKLKTQNKQLANIKEITLANFYADTLGAEFNLESLIIDKADIQTTLYKDMSTDFDRLVGDKTKDEDIKEEKPKEGTKTPLFSVEKFEIKNSSFSLVDKERKTTLKLKKINTQVKDAKFSKSSTIPFSFSYLTPTSGNMKGDGEIRLNPLVVKVNLKIDKMNLKPYNPYIQDYVNLNLNSGYLTSKTSIKVFGEKINFRGYARLLKVDLSHSINKETLFKAKSLNFNRIKATNNSLKMNSIVLDKTYMNFAIDKNATTNLSDIVIVKDDGVGEDKNTTNDFKFLISKIEFKDGSMDFLDESLPIDFQVHINSLNGNILTISSNPKESLEVKIDGVVNKYGQAHIKGDVITIDPKKSLNLVVDFKNIDVTKMSGYSGKFIGREIAKGKLWIALNYKIKDSQLLSTNSIKLKDLELGDSVDSKDETSLPVGLAIALLKDSDGYIDIDMPVEGDVDNPDFKYGGAVWGAVGNLLTSIISSPFNFLAKSLGIDDEELSIINFEYGSSQLLPIQNEKLDKLYELLKKRPELVLVINPVVSKEKDIFALKRQVFNKKILENISKKDDIEDKYEFVSDMYVEKFSKEKQKELLDNLTEQKYVKDAFDEERFNRESLALISIQELDTNALNTLAIQRQNSIALHIKTLGLDLKQLELKETITKLEKSQEGVDLVLILDVKH
ncbi:MAG: DUF748 domain-containing protein [Sulfurimonas sp.]|nr:DUF748 domain-containing protein [Sulfurimonas sp.]